jgi:hypothetical protein
MERGSLVQCISNQIAYPFKEIHVKWKPNVGDIYTVKEVTDSFLGIYLVFLEEGCCGHLPNGIELAFSNHNFKEVQKPMNLSWVHELQHKR